MPPVLSNPIYRRDAKGQIRTWWYEVVGDEWRTHSGLEGGEIVASGWTKCVPKSQDTAEAQALFEARAEQQKKLDRVYRRTVEELDGPMMFEPMLAQNYKTWPGQSVFVQPKLDGMRCIATPEGLFSRNGKQIIGVPHIEEALQGFFARHPDVILDGELYTHEFREDFEEIMSLARKQKAPAEDCEKIQYHVYDCFDHSDDDFCQRSIFLHGCWPIDADCDPIVLVNTQIAETAEQLEIIKEANLDLGYEGTMVRLNQAYEPGKRSKSLLKLKEFEDTEFPIVCIEEGKGNWAGYAKRLTILLPDGTTSGAGIKGKRDAMRKLLEEKDQWVGKIVTIKHFGYTKAGKPRKPVAIKFWSGEKE